MTSTRTEPQQPQEPKLSSTAAVFEAACHALLLTAIGVLLGALLMILTTDYGLLYTNVVPTSEAYLRSEQTYLMLWTSPLIIKAILHLTLVIPIFTLAIKVSRYTEAAIYFDGLCLVIMLLVLGLYTGSTVPNLRKLAAAPSNEQLVELISNWNQSPSSSSLGSNFFNNLLVFLSYPATILLKPQRALERQEAFEKNLKSNPIDLKTRIELLSVTAAGHSIAILLLIGIVLLQIGKVYAQVEDAKLKQKFHLDQSKLLSKDKKNN